MLYSLFELILKFRSILKSLGVLMLLVLTLTLENLLHGYLGLSLFVESQFWSDVQTIVLDFTSGLLSFFLNFGDMDSQIILLFDLFLTIFCLLA